MSAYWNPPEAWTLSTANKRAREVLSDPDLDEHNQPPEAALLFPPAAPKFPPLVDKNGNEMTVSRKGQTFVMRNIPWLPASFNMSTPGWLINLYMVFGATPRDMVDRVPSSFDPNRDRQLLSNRLVKRSSDYRVVHGGFCQDYTAFKSGKITLIAKHIVLGQAGKRAALSPEQLFFGVIWDVDPKTRRMRQSEESQAFKLPEPSECVRKRLSDILSHLQIPIPHLTQFPWALLVAPTSHPSRFQKSLPCNRTSASRPQNRLQTPDAEDVPDLADLSSPDSQVESPGDMSICSNNAFMGHMRDLPRNPGGLLANHANHAPMNTMGQHHWTPMPTMPSFPAFFPHHGNLPNYQHRAPQTMVNHRQFLVAPQVSTAIDPRILNLHPANIPHRAGTGIQANMAGSLNQITPEDLKIDLGLNWEDPGWFKEVVDLT